MTDNPPLPVNNATTFRETGKNKTGGEKQHLGYLRTNAASKEAHFVAPKSFPNAIAASPTKGPKKYTGIYKKYDLTNYPDDHVEAKDIRENFYGDINSHWLLKWVDDGRTYHAGTMAYEDRLDDGDFYSTQLRTLQWRKINQDVLNILKAPKSEKEFTEALFSLFLYQGYLTEDLMNLKVGEIKVVGNSWCFDGYQVCMTQDVFDYADKLLYLKDSNAYVFSFKHQNDPFYQIGMDDLAWLNIKMSKFRLLYGTLVQLHKTDMLQGVTEKNALSHMIAVSAPVARYYEQSLEELWESIPFEAVKSYLITGRKKGNNLKTVDEIEEFAEKLLTDTLKFPLRLGAILGPFDFDFCETFLGKAQYDAIPDLDEDGCTNDSQKKLAEF